MSATATRDVSERYAELRERLAIADALLSRADVAMLGLPRRAIDQAFGRCPIVVIPGYSRPFIRVRDYLEWIERNEYGTGQVRPSARRA